MYKHVPTILIHSIHVMHILSLLLIASDGNRENINDSSKPMNISSKYMDELSNYIISGSFIEMQETVGQGLSRIELNS